MRKKYFSSIFTASFFLFAFVWCSSVRAYELTPEGEKLYNQWKELLGYNEFDLVKQMDPAPEIKAGLVITPENAGQYPGLKLVLPDYVYERLDPKHFCPVEKMTITETRPRYYPQPVIDYTREGKPTINKETLQLENYKGGVPFPHPQDGLEMMWNHTCAQLNFEENLWMDPIVMTTYNAERKVDSMWKAMLGRYRCYGRLFTDIGKDGVSKYFQNTGIFEQGTLLITYPTDLKGTAFLRTRYWDVNKPDYFVSYLPGLRRIRVLSGSDAQDPILGCELIWDEWALDWQKAPSKKIWPNEYKILGKRVILSPVYHSSPSMDIKGEQIITEWEKRPVWVFEIDSLDPTYVFSKRIHYMDMMHFKLLASEYYDRRGSLMRTWNDFKIMHPDGQCAWEGASIMNHITERHSVARVDSTPNAATTPDQFDMRWLVEWHGRQ